MSWGREKSNKRRGDPFRITLGSWGEKDRMGKIAEIGGKNGPTKNLESKFWHRDTPYAGGTRGGILNKWGGGMGIRGKRGKHKIIKIIFFVKHFGTQLARGTLVQTISGTG